MVDVATGTVSGLLILNVAQLVTTVLKRRWDVEDRKALAAKVEADGVERDKATAAAVAARDEILLMIKKAHDEISANTKVSTEAFHEANGAKQLIADVNKSLEDEVRRRNDIAATAEAQAALRPLTDPLAAARLISDLRARVDLLERRAHSSQRLKRHSRKGVRK